MVALSCRFVAYYRSRMDLNITLTEREREIILDAIVAWENEGCHNSTSRDIRDDDFHGLLTKLKADKSIDRA